MVKEQKGRKMQQENKIALGILVGGVVALSLYWFLPTSSPKPIIKKVEQEQIILPKEGRVHHAKIPEVEAYLEQLSALMRRGEAVIPLGEEELESRSKRVQTFLLKNPQFLADTHHNKQLLHNDMMRILPALVGSIPERFQQQCKAHHCYEAQKYNFVTNTTTKALVDSDTLSLLSLERYPQMQPDISLRLTHIAQAIALASEDVKEALGKTPSFKDMTMANVRGTMKESPCQNTSHLCVAPTFSDHHAQKALWAVVDLTELRLAAAKWAGLGKTTTPACISERALQNRYIMKHFCQKDTLLKRNGWEISYRLTGSDGLEVHHVSFNGKPVLDSAKIVDWHVSYQEKGGESLDTSTQSYIEGRRVEFRKEEDGNYLFGYNDAMGCPLFSTSVVLAFNAPQIKPLPFGDGFMLTQDFRNPKWPMACNYRYENRFEFYNDGSFRVVGVNKGRGCGDHAIYRPVMRIDVNLGAEEKFYSATQEGWREWLVEGSEFVPTHTTPYPYKITSASDVTRGYKIEPNHGQFHDQSRGDNATLFVTHFHPNEGESDLLTLGSCCNLKEDGVERYVEDNESIDAKKIVLWYVPRIYNDSKKGEEYCWADSIVDDSGNIEVKVWPCTVGPKFIPLKGAE
jgi:hypothetical protein